MSSQAAMSNKKDEKGKNIQVVVRCRPFNQLERKANSHSVLEFDEKKKDVSVRTGAINDKLGKKTYTFDMVFGPSAKQIEVYRNVVCPILDEVIMGYNCTIFAYGQTGTGKTFTMEGERSSDGEFTWEQDPLAGIIPRTLHQIFEKLSENGTEFSVKVSLLEIYNEELFDLLSPLPDVGEKLQMFDDPRNKRGVIIKGLEEVTVHNKDEVYHILERGAAKRTTASTLMNAYSSRSHSVFSITIHMKETTVDGEELVKIGKLNLVDLAGSENIGRSGAVDKRAREAGNINQSLLTLGRVITALVERAPHIPYRESKLTRILQDSLGGRTKTSIIATVSPASINLEETVSTLEYANRAKSIMNKPEVNQKLTKRALIKEYTEEIERLKRDLAAAREKNGIYLSSENYEALQSKVVSQEEQITEYIEKISALEEEVKRVTELFSESNKELEECSTILQCKEKDLAETQKNLQESKQQLAQEEFLVSALEKTEKSLHKTANKLLFTVQESTKDVSGLHAKLDRKRVVDQHNAEVHENFADVMEHKFQTIQRSVENYSVKQQGMVDSYSRAIHAFLNTTTSALNATASAVSASFTTVTETLSRQVTASTEEILKQMGLSSQAKDDLQKLIVANQFSLQKVIATDLLPIVSSVVDLNSHLRKCLQRFSSVADKVDLHKEEMEEFFTNHSMMLHKLRLESTSALAGIQAESQALREELQAAQDLHSQGINELLSSMQNQLNLFALKTSKSFQDVQLKGERLHNSATHLKEDLNTVTSEAIEGTSTHQRSCVECCVDVAGEIRELAGSSIKSVEDSSGKCETLGTSLSAVSKDAESLCDVTSCKISDITQQQESYFHLAKTQLQSFQKDTESFCNTSVEQILNMVNQEQMSQEKALSSFMEQANEDKLTIIEQKLELDEQAQSGLNKVYAYFKEELRVDLPTGTTPQRKEYTYPSVLATTMPKEVLLEKFRKQQEEFQAAITSVLAIAEEPVDQDSLKDEAVAVDDSITSASSIVDVNVFCLENSGVPFFQQKRGNRKEKENKGTNTSVLEQSKASDDGEPSFPKSKLPLRVHN